MLIKDNCFCQLWTKPGVGFRTEPWQTYIEHPSGRFVLFKGGGEIIVTFRSLLSPYLHPSTQQVQKDRVQVLRQLSSVRGIMGKLSSDIIGVRNKRQGAWSLRFLKCKYPTVEDWFFLGELLESVKILFILGTDSF